jgi:hypothetical protein
MSIRVYYDLRRNVSLIDDGTVVQVIPRSPLHANTCTTS